MAGRARSRDQINSVVDELHKGHILIDDREIFVHPHLDDTEGDDTDYRMSTYFIKNLRLLMTNIPPKKDELTPPILVHFYNCGGEWGPGMQIYDAIATCQTYITALLHGDAISMGSIIPLAADKVVMMPNSRMMLHGGDGTLQGTYKQVKSEQKELDREHNKMMEIYIEVCAKGPFFKNKTAKQISNFINKEFDINEDWYIDAEQAVDYGLAHGILGEKGFEDIETIKEHNE